MMTIHRALLTAAVAGTLCVGCTRHPAQVAETGTIQPSYDGFGMGSGGRGDGVAPQPTPTGTAAGEAVPADSTPTSLGGSLGPGH